MVLVATAADWAATLETTSERARVGRGAHVVEAEWTSTGLRARDRAALPGRDVLQELQRQLRDGAYARAGEIRAELAAVLDAARNGVQPPSPGGLVRVDRDPTRKPVTFVVELYDPLVDRSRRLHSSLALSRWWARALAAFGPDWSAGPRAGTITREERVGIVSEVISTRAAPWPPPTEPLPVPVPAYEILGVPLTASDAEVHAAYVAQIHLNHPARVAHLSEGLQRAAVEQTWKILQAYAMIRGHRAAA